MQSEKDLLQLLQRIDHKGYPAYKDTRGSYQFYGYVLTIEHVQGDPYASPSKVRFTVDGKKSGFSEDCYKQPHRRIAMQDFLLRQIGKKIHAFSMKNKESKRTGSISISRPGQEILNRSACSINAENGEITIRMEIGFPANGRTISVAGLKKILFQFLPECVEESLVRKAYIMQQLEEVLFLADDQFALRTELKKAKLAAFIANGSILPRESGISKLPLKDAIPFQSPASLEVSITLPHRGTIKGMGIKRGVTLIVGGGYHGKSTLLKAIETGVYNHISGDGREFVITEENAIKLRAEDGRSIQNVNISMFIQNLPNGKNTEQFYTEDASGSTSQAANTVEAIEAGAKVFLIDEDTSATNFMIRDELMQRVVHREVEPIIPFIDRVRELYEKEGISTILVAGSCGAYFHRADCILQMNRYEPEDITEFAKKEAAKFPLKIEELKPAESLNFHRVVQKDEAFAKERKIKIKTMGTDSILIQHEEINLRFLEQLVDKEQTIALAEIVRYLKLHVFDGKETLSQAVEQLYGQIEEKEFAAFCEGRIPGNFALPRKQEIYEVLNRCRGLLCIK